MKLHLPSLAIVPIVALVLAGCAPAEPSFASSSGQTEVFELGQVKDSGICLIRVVVTPTENMASETLFISAGVWAVELEGQPSEVIDAIGDATSSDLTEIPYIESGETLTRELFIDCEYKAPLDGSKITLWVAGNGAKTLDSVIITASN